MKTTASSPLILSLSKEEAAAPRVDASRFDKLSMRRKATTPQASTP